MLGTLKFTIGVLLGLMGLGSIASGAGYYFYQAQQVRSPKPIFAEERSTQKVTKGSTSGKKSPKNTASTSPSSSPIPDTAYVGKVTWQGGLVLKKDPDANSEKIGGVQKDDLVTVLKESEDKQWLQIKSEQGEETGWVKSGNIEK